jgi:hypothetical protein
MQLPGRFGLLSKAGGIEWPTWAMLATCYTIWLASIAWHDVLGAWWMLPAAVMVTLHSSLQHEALHGHPTQLGRAQRGAGVSSPRACSCPIAVFATRTFATTMTPT